MRGRPSTTSRQIFVLLVLKCEITIVLSLITSNAAGTTVLNVSGSLQSGNHQAHK